MSSPKVSVIIGTFNQAKYIRATLESVFGQTFRDYEVVVADDASTDGTLNELQRAGDRIRLIARTDNSGLPAVPRNQAIRAAKGEYLAFLDADDLWHPSKLERQVLFMGQHPEVGMSHCYCNVINEEGCILRIRHDGRLPETGDCFAELLNHCFISTSTVMVREGVLRSVGMFDESPMMRTGEDYDFYLRVARLNKVGLVNEVLASYRECTGSVSRTSNWRGTPEHVPTLLRYWQKKEFWAGRVPPSCVRRSLLHACMENSQYWRDQGYGKRAAWFAIKAIQRGPLQREAWMALVKSMARMLIKREA